MRTADGKWVEEALARIEATEGMDPAARRDFLRSEHAASQVSAATLHRQMEAARWLSRHARSYRVALDEVKCSYPAVEDLARLEAARPDHAANVAADVLRGRLTAEQTAALSAVTRKRRAPRQPNEWQVFLIEFVLYRIPDLRAYGDQLPEWSRRALMLRVDLEGVLADGRTIAVFFSPLSIFAQNATLPDVWRSASAARLFYDQVTFLAEDDEERSFMAEFASREGAVGAFTIPP